MIVAMETGGTAATYDGIRRILQNTLDIMALLEETEHWFVFEVY